jgi:hypothetical protein
MENIIKKIIDVISVLFVIACFITVIALIVSGSVIGITIGIVVLGVIALLLLCNGTYIIFNWLDTKH